MNNKVKILIVEDDMIIGAKISMQLLRLGYEVTGVIPSGEEALLNVKTHQPDIVLLDINLKGKMDGIETAKQVLTVSDIPIIYVTANSDEATFNRAKETRPYAFISKPIKNLDLQRAIELTISRLAEKADTLEDEPESMPDSYVLNDRIFVKQNGKMVKLLLSEILYLEADRNYSHLYTRQDKYTISYPLKKMETKLPTSDFLRIHRSYIANISQIEEVSENHILIHQKQLLLSSTFREELMKRLKTL